MRDLRGALALARQKVLETSGNSGNTGNAFENASQNKRLPDLHLVSTADDEVETLETKSPSVATVSTSRVSVETPRGPKKLESEQHLTEAVATVSTVSTQNRSEPGELDHEQWWDDVMAATERASILEHDAGMPRVWADALALMIEKPPAAALDPDRWQTVTDAALAFSDRWAGEAYRLGWRAEELLAGDGLAVLLADGAAVA